MESDSFYGVTLSEKEPLAQFLVNENDKLEQKIIIKQITLGYEAKEGEFNVVQVETRINEKDTIKIPIAVLKAGETRILRPNVEFPSASVTFKLIQGNGPVYICGQNVVNEIVEMEPYNEDEEIDEYDDEGLIPQTNGKNLMRKK